MDKTSTLFLGTSKEKRFLYPTENLKKHFISLGNSGSGKTVLSKVLIEECAKLKIPSIVVDPQGDLASLAINADEDTLNKYGLTREDYLKFHENTAVEIFTPISSKGIAISINPLKLERNKNIDMEEVITLVHSISTSVCRLLGYDVDKDKGKAAEALVYSIIKYNYNKNNTISNFGELADILANMDDNLKDELKEFIYDEKDIQLLIKKLRFMEIGEKKLLFEFGVPMDIPLLLGKKRKDGKTQVSVIYLNTLQSQEDKDFFLSILTTRLYNWMLDNPSDTVQCVYMIDEIAPFIPAGARKPIPKPILKLLFKQARKYGVSCVIATQNPGDIDYKAFAQFGTWAIGRLTVKQDQKKVEGALKSLSSQNLENYLPKLKPGNFLVFSPDISNELIELKVRWLYSMHKTLTEDDVKELADPYRKNYTSYISKTSSKDDEKALRMQMSAKKNEKLFFSHITKDKAYEIARKNAKRKFIIGKKEEIIGFKETYIPFIMATVRVNESKIFGLSKQISEYTVFFNGTNGDLIKINNKKFEKINLFNYLFTANNKVVKTFKLLNENNRDFELDEMVEKLSTTKATLIKTLAEMLGEGIIKYEKEEKDVYDISLKNESLANVEKIASKGFELTTKSISEKYDKELLIEDMQIKTDKISKFLGELFNSAEIVDEKLVYFVEYNIRYSLDDKVRVIKINGSNSEVLNEV